MYNAKNERNAQSEGGIEPPRLQNRLQKVFTDEELFSNETFPPFYQIYLWNHTLSPQCRIFSDSRKRTIASHK